MGFGTYPLTGDAARAAIGMALELGFRHIDTAQMYGNEADVGAAIAGSGLDRTDVFVTTKVNHENLAPGRLVASVRRSLDQLRMATVDLLLIHWPPTEMAALDVALDQLNEAADLGLCARIGISNFPVLFMRRAVARSRHRLAANQVEFHPLLDQSRLKAAADEMGIALTAYCPVARGRALAEPVVMRIAERLGESPATIVLAWIIQNGVVAVPKTTKAANARANLRALDIKLDAEDFAALTELTKTNRRLVSPSDMTALWDH